MEVTGANRRWRCQFRYRGSRRESAVAQLFSLGGILHNEKIDYYRSHWSFNSCHWSGVLARQEQEERNAESGGRLCRRRYKRFHKYDFHHYGDLGGCERSFRSWYHQRNADSIPVSFRIYGIFTRCGNRDISAWLQFFRLARHNIRARHWHVIHSAR